MKTILVIFTSIFLSFSSFASDLSTSIYSGTTSQSPTKPGCVQVIFDMIGYSGVIGNATFSNVTHVLSIAPGRDGDRLNQISYTVTGGTLVIVEVK